MIYLVDHINPCQNNTYLIEQCPKDDLKVLGPDAVN